MKVLDLFSGIGGFSLGLERAGMTTVAFCEIDPWARRVLAKHWPTVPIYEDVTKLKGADIGPVDLVCGGFPCQDISCAGKGAGLEGSRSGLWWEMHRIITELRPRWVLAENVPALRTRGADEVLGSLEGLGYTVWPLVVGADDIGAPHRRKRVWIVAHARGPEQGRRDEPERGPDRRVPEPTGDGASQPVAHAEGLTERPGLCEGEPGGQRWRRPGDGGRENDLADADRIRRDPIVGAEEDEREKARRRQPTWAQTLGQPVGNPGGAGPSQREGAAGERPHAATSGTGWWAAQSGMGRAFDGLSPWLDGTWEHGIPRTANGIPNRVNRLRGLGNAVVPQIPELIGRAIMQTQTPQKPSSTPLTPLTTLLHTPTN